MASRAAADTRAAPPREQRVPRAPETARAPAAGGECPAARWACRRWLLAGSTALATACLLPLTGLLAPLPGAVEALAIFVSGWVVFALLAPRAIMRQLQPDDRPALAALADQARAVADGDRRVPLSDLVLPRDDELGALSRAVHDLAAAAHAHRQQKRLMQRRLGHHVQRETHKATFHLQREAMTDPLTGLGNRRALRRHVERLVTRYGPRAKAAVILVDVDRFKHINDTLGHPVGDRCLTFLAEVLRSCLRRHDALIRMGGDEFAVLMPNATAEGAHPAAQRVIALFKQMPWPHGSVPRPTVSIGVAQGAAGELLNDAALLARADAALYEAKRAGRSTVVVKAA